MKQKEESTIGSYDNIFLIIRPDLAPCFYLSKRVSGSVLWETCIRITENSYYDDIAEAHRLDGEEKKALTSFLLQPNADIPKVSNWQAVLLAWSQNNPHNRVPRNTPMPDYSSL